MYNIINRSVLLFAYFGQEGGDFAASARGGLPLLHPEVEVLVEVLLAALGEQAVAQVPLLEAAAAPQHLLLGLLLELLGGRDRGVHVAREGPLEHRAGLHQLVAGGGARRHCADGAERGHRRVALLVRLHGAPGEPVPHLLQTGLVRDHHGLVTEQRLLAEVGQPDALLLPLWLFLLLFLFLPLLVSLPLNIPAFLQDVRPALPLGRQVELVGQLLVVDLRGAQLEEVLRQPLRVDLDQAALGLIGASGLRAVYTEEEPATLSVQEPAPSCAGSS